MKLTRINIRNYLGARAVDLSIATPVTLIAGPNGAGKSSTLEAIRHAIGGEAGRVALKKDFKALIADGADAGFVTVATDDGDRSVVLPSGKGVHSSGAALPFVLDPGLFARISADERRGFLFDLMGVATDGPAVAARIAARGCDTAKFQQIQAKLAGGFPEAAKEAAARARDAKAAWKTTTSGDTWGKDKAAGWKATRPAETYGREQIKIAEGLLAETDQEIAAANQQLGEIRAGGKQRADAEARVDLLKLKAARLTAIRDKLARDSDELNVWEAKLAELPAPGGVQPKALGCPCCGAALQVLKDGTLAEYQLAKGGALDVELETKRKQQQDAVDLFARSVANDRRDLAEAERAIDELVNLEQTIATLPAASSTGAVEVKLDALKADRKARAATLDAMLDTNRQAQVANGLTLKAASHHADVLAWAAIADTLAPDGIPGELLADALTPINARLAQSALDAQWARIEIAPDMAIRSGLNKRPYALLSESEQWRADAMIAEAISRLSGLCLMLLDRFDVLDLKGRGDALAWLDILAAEGEVDSVIVAGTLKALPAGLPESVGAAWVEGGVAGGVREAA